MSIPKNKTTCDKVLSQILKTYRSGQTLPKTISDKLVPILKMTQYHKLVENTGSKLGVKTVKYAGGYRCKSLVLFLPNKKVIPLSKKRILEQIYGKPKKRRGTLPEKVLSALRREIRPQITRFSEYIRESGELGVCPYLGKSLQNCATAVDHVTPFIQLVKDFAKTQKVDLFRLKIAGRGTNIYIQDRSIAKAWFDYHLKHSDLELISQEANSMKGARQLTRKF